MKEFRSKRLRVWENISRTMQEFKVLLLGYRSYTALLTQTGTDAPVATVLDNTIGNIWFTYDSVGVYFVVSDGLFTENKTVIFMNGNNSLVFGIYPSNNNVPNDITIETGKNSNGTYSDGILNNAPIEIRVYN